MQFMVCMRFISECHERQKKQFFTTHGDVFVWNSFLFLLSFPLCIHKDYLVLYNLCVFQTFTLHCFAFNLCVMLF